MLPKIALIITVSISWVGVQLYRSWYFFIAKRPVASSTLGALGSTFGQRCWVHKTDNVLNKLPKNIQAKVKDKLHQIWMADNKDEAEYNFDAFIETYSAKYPKAADCLRKDRDVLLTFYDFPAEHWRHIRTTNPIESTLQLFG